MKKIILLMLVLSLVFAAVSITSAEQGQGWVYLVNATSKGPVVIGSCKKAKYISAKPGEYPICNSSDVTKFKIGLDENSLALVDVTNEGNFKVILPDGRTIQGALETVFHISPDIKSYYVYVWKIEVPSK